MKQYERYDMGVNRSRLLPSRLCKQKSPMTVDRQMRSISTHVTLHHVNLPEQPLVPAIYAIALPSISECTVRYIGKRRNDGVNSCNEHFDD